MNFLPSKSRFKNVQQIIKEKKKKKYIFVIFDPFLTLGYLEMIKGFLHPINAVPYFTVWAAHKNFTVLVIFISIF